MPSKRTIVPGDQFGRWAILERDLSRSQSRGHHWLCRCTCGTVRTVRAFRLLSGESLSCGCLARELIAQRNQTHGLYYTAEHRAWAGMRTRCRNPKSDSYDRYGGRGITVDSSWDSFEQFLADMGPRPGAGYSIERIDNDGPYAPGNCRWATVLEQARNKHNNTRLTYHGQTMALSAWAEAKGIRADTIMARIGHGWSIEKALTTPTRPHRRATHT